ncbi:MAG: hypothetical protein OXH94_05160 [Rhodospirillales bacterium]|nr:hypothetical protein [Rhodospirillales bacterium]
MTPAPARLPVRPVLLGAWLAAAVASFGAYAEESVSGSTKAAAAESAAGKSMPDVSAAPMAGFAGPANLGAVSRLLRALEGGGAVPPEQTQTISSSNKAASTPLPSYRAPGAAPPVIPASVIDGCPRGMLTRLLANAASKEDALSALAIEHETLKLCHERQRIVTGIFEAEARLRELRAPADPPPAAISRAPVPVSVIRPQLSTAVTSAPVATAVPEPAKTPPKRPRYGWFSIVGMSGDLRAGVTDGQRVWFVREGDALPGAVRVGRIAARPPGVRLKGGGDGQLPYRTRPGGGK